MRQRLLFSLATSLLIFGTFALLYAQNDALKTQTGQATKQSNSDRFDLKTQTKVGKKLDRVVDGPKGKEYHYTYRVEASPTATDMPRYTVDPRYGVTFKKEGFQENDSVTLLSKNAESDTDSPIWVYDVTYQGSGERKITFETTGSVMTPMFAVANSETDPDDPNDPVDPGSDCTCTNATDCPGCSCDQCQSGGGCTCPCHGSDEETPEVPGDVPPTTSTQDPCPPM